MHLVIPATDHHDYADLRVLMASIASYLPPGHKVTILWKGKRPPQVFGTKLQQAPQNQTFGEALKEALQIITDPEWLILNDDVVIGPETIPQLEEDLARLRADDSLPIGLVGLRSNAIAWSPQNIRWVPTPSPQLEGFRWRHESTMFEVEQVFGVAFWVERATLLEAPPDWLALHWYSDNLLSYDLRQLGFRHFVSRAYVHHLGSRASGGEAQWKSWELAAQSWLRQHRPDFAQRFPWGGGDGGWAPGATASAITKNTKPPGSPPPDSPLVPSAGAGSGPPLPEDPLPDGVG